MTINSEQIQALKAAAEKAGADEWQAKVISGDGYVIRKGSFRKECGWNTYQPIAEFDDKKVRDFVAAANPAVILSLLADRDADKALIAELKPIAAHAQRGWQEAHEQEALVEQAMTRIAELEDAEQKLCAANVTLDARAELAERRLTELEARTLTVKLPERCECCYSEKEAALFDGVVEEYTEALESACAAAGITLVVGE